MELNGGSAFRHGRSSSSDRFLDLFSFSPPSSTIDTGGDELNEDDVLWDGDEFTGTKHQQLHRTTTYTKATATATAISNYRIDRLHRRYLNFQPLENSGILAALPESDPHSQTLGEGQVLYRKPSISTSSSSSKTIASIPRPPQERDYSQSQSVPCRKFHQSAPMKVPVLSKVMEKQRNGELADVGDEIDDDEMLPPHEIVARGSGMSPKTTFSVLEGVGRTLKGRDLRQVRNAIWRKTGFLD